MTQPAIIREDLEAAAREGLWPAKAAERFGVTHVTIRRAEDRTGIKLDRVEKGAHRYGNDYRAAAESMRPADAVEFLLDVIESLRVKPDHEWQLPGIHLTRSERQLLRAMADASPRILTRDHAITAIMAGREADDAPDEKIIDVFLSRIRKKLDPLGITFTTHWGVGWTIAKPDGFVWPWEAAA